MLSLREQENQAALEKHKEECEASAKAHLAELETLRISNDELRIPKDLGFWERKRRQVERLRTKNL